MAKRQTRRAISVKGLTYQRLKAYCDAQGRSVSGFLEDIVHEKMDDLGQPRETLLKGRPNGHKHKVRPNPATPPEFTY